MTKEFPNSTDYAGIDYSIGQSNRNHLTGFRFGVISHHEVLQAWADSSEILYPDCEEHGQECPEECDFFEYAESCGAMIKDDEYLAHCGEDGDIFVERSPYYTFAQFCSPCAPGACHLSNPMDEDHMYTDNRCYCFGHDFFDEGKAPYPVYRVSDNKRVLPPADVEHS